MSEPSEDQSPAVIQRFEAQVAVLEAAVRALAAGIGDPSRAQALLRDHLEEQRSMGLNREHWPPLGYAEIETAIDVLTGGAGSSWPRLPDARRR